MHRNSGDLYPKFLPWPWIKKMDVAHIMCPLGFVSLRASLKMWRLLWSILRWVRAEGRKLGKFLSVGDCICYSVFIELNSITYNNIKYIFGISLVPNRRDMPRAESWKVWGFKNDERIQHRLEPLQDVVHSCPIVDQIGVALNLDGQTFCSQLSLKKMPLCNSLVSGQI